MLHCEWFIPSMESRNGWGVPVSRWCSPGCKNHGRSYPVNRLRRRKMKAQPQVWSKQYGEMDMERYTGSI